MSEDVHSFGWVTNRVNAVNGDVAARDYLNVIGFHADAADGIENGFADAGRSSNLCVYVLKDRTRLPLSYKGVVGI